MAVELGSHTPHWLLQLYFENPKTIANIFDKSNLLFMWEQQMYYYSYFCQHESRNWAPDRNVNNVMYIVPLFLLLYLPFS